MALPEHSSELNLLILSGLLVGEVQVLPPGLRVQGLPPGLRVQGLRAAPQMVVLVRAELEPQQLKVVTEGKNRSCCRKLRRAQG